MYTNEKGEIVNFMIPINRAIVDTISKQQNSKRTMGKNDSVLYPIYVHSVTNSSDCSRNYSTYEMAHWTNYVDHFCVSKNTDTPNTIGYKRGTIVFVDLGAGNFGHEPSYTHPAVVLQQNKFSILIAPCSSKKYGKGIPCIIDASIADGFSVNTGVQTDSIRWISKERVISKHGSVSNSILDRIDSVLLNAIPTYKRVIHEKNNVISQLESDKLETEKANALLKSEKADLEREIKELTAKIDYLDVSIHSTKE